MAEPQNNVDEESGEAKDLDISPSNITISPPQAFSVEQAPTKTNRKPYVLTEKRKESLARANKVRMEKLQKLKNLEDEKSHTISELRNFFEQKIRDFENFDMGKKENSSKSREDEAKEPFILEPTPTEEKLPHKKKKAVEESSDESSESDDSGNEESSESEEEKPRKPVKKVKSGKKSKKSYKAKSYESKKRPKKRVQEVYSSSSEEESDDESVDLQPRKSRKNDDYKGYTHERPRYPATIRAMPSVGGFSRQGFF